MSIKKLVILFGPPAVGKMTVGRELSVLTGMKLFHNHMTIELVLPFFEFGTPPYVQLVETFRRMIVEEVAQSDLPGLIFTFVWALNLESDRRYLQNMADIFRQQGGVIYYVELQAALEERLVRNKTEFRLSQKPSKQNVVWSEQNLLELEANYQLNSDGDLVVDGYYWKLDNTHLSPAEAARQIVAHFGW